MRYLKMLGLSTLAATALMAAAAGTASASTLEIAGTVQNGAVAITASVDSSLALTDTEGTQFFTCTVSQLQGTTSVFSGSKVTASLHELSYSSCTRSPVIVDNKGSLYIEYEGSGTSGSVFSENTVVTVPTTFGFTVTCTTAAGGTKIGTLNGVKSSSEHATVKIAAVLSCGFLLPSVGWSGKYIVTSPTGLGIRL